MGVEAGLGTPLLGRPHLGQRPEHLRGLLAAFEPSTVAALAQFVAMCLDGRQRLSNRVRDAMPRQRIPATFRTRHYERNRALLVPLHLAAPESGVAVLPSPTALSQWERLMVKASMSVDKKFFGGIRQLAPTPADEAKVVIWPAAHPGETPS